MATFNIPTNVFAKSFSGPSDETKALAPKAGNLAFSNPFDTLKAGDTAGLGDRLRNVFTPGFNLVNNSFDSAKDELGTLYEGTLKPATQKFVNSMVARGTLNSGVAADALRSLGSERENAIAGFGVDLDTQRANVLSGLFSQYASAASNLDPLLLQLGLNRQQIGAGLLPAIGNISTSEDPLQAYSIMASLLK